MAKRPSLTDMPISARLAPKGSDRPQEAPPATESAPAPANDGPRDFKTMMCRVNRAGWAEMSRLSIDTGLNLEDLLIEACNDLLRKHGHPPVVEKRSPARRQ